MKNKGIFEGPPANPTSLGNVWVGVTKPDAGALTRFLKPIDVTQPGRPQLMSVRIGEVNPNLGDANNAAVHVAASRAGVELHSDPNVTLDPVQARNYAALLVRAAEEVEMMRRREPVP